MTRRVRTAILISGRGSNMEALATAAKNPDYPADIALVVSNRPKAAGLQKAKVLGVPTLCLDHKKFGSRKAFDAALNSYLIDADIEFICCAGFMRILTPEFIAKWPDKILNIHPSLLPKYKGLNTHQRAIEAGDKEHGCTVHYVTDNLDSGEVIAQESIQVLEGDTEETLSERLRPIENSLYVKALEQAIKKPG